MITKKSSLRWCAAFTYIFIIDHIHGLVTECLLLHSLHPYTDIYSKVTQCHSCQRRRRDAAPRRAADLSVCGFCRLCERAAGEMWNLRQAANGHMSKSYSFKQWFRQFCICPYFLPYPLLYSFNSHVCLSQVYL